MGVAVLAPDADGLSVLLEGLPDTVNGDPVHLSFWRQLLAGRVGGSVVVDGEARGEQRG